MTDTIKKGTSSKGKERCSVRLTLRQRGTENALSTLALTTSTRRICKLLMCVVPEPSRSHQVANSMLQIGSLTVEWPEISYAIKDSTIIYRSKAEHDCRDAVLL